MKTHALPLLRTKNLRYAVLRFQDFQRRPYGQKMKESLSYSNYGATLRSFQGRLNTIIPARGFVVLVKQWVESGPHLIQ
jgi:hypothetical protein